MANSFDGSKFIPTSVVIVIVILLILVGMIMGFVASISKLAIALVMLCAIYIFWKYLTK